MFKLVCEKQLHGQKSQAKVGRNRKRHALKVGYDIKSWKLLPKQGLSTKL
jgi:hypothetical protein